MRSTWQRKMRTQLDGTPDESNPKDNQRLLLEWLVEAEAMIGDMEDRDFDTQGDPTWDLYDAITKLQRKLED